MTLVRFGCVGVTNTLVTFAAYMLLTGAHVTTGMASALGFAAGAANGYVLNRSWTFRVRGGPATFARYVAVQALGAACSAVGVAALPEFLVIPVVTLITYSLSRRMVFRAAGPAAVPSSS
jgi:putative flippase GtrA